MTSSGILPGAPARIDRGNPADGPRNTPKVVGGHTGACARRAVAFYQRLVDTDLPVPGTREAEMAKPLENTYRHVDTARLLNAELSYCDPYVPAWGWTAGPSRAKRTSPRVERH